MESISEKQGVGYLAITEKLQLRYLSGTLPTRLLWLGGNPESDQPDTTVPDLEVLDPDTDKTTESNHDDTVNMHKKQ